MSRNVINRDRVCQRGSPLFEDLGRVEHNTSVRSLDHQYKILNGDSDRLRKIDKKVCLRSTKAGIRPLQSVCSQRLDKIILTGDPKTDFFTKTSNQEVARNTLFREERLGQDSFWRICYQKDGQRLDFVDLFKDGKRVQRYQYRQDGQTIKTASYYQDNQMIKMANYRQGGRVLKSLDQFQDGNIVKSTHYQKDGISPDFVENYHDGFLTDSVHYQGDGKTIHYKTSYDQNQDVQGRAWYHPDGETIKCFDIYSAKTDFERHYYKKGNQQLSSTSQYRDNKIEESKHYQADGQTIKSVERFQNQKLAEAVFYWDDGKSVKSLEGYQDGVLSQLCEYRQDGTVKSLAKYKNGEIDQCYRYLRDGKTIGRLDSFQNNKLVETGYYHKDSQLLESKKYFLDGGLYRFVRYQPDGKSLKSSAHYQYGELSQTAYYENGAHAPNRMDIFKDGRVVESITYNQATGRPVYSVESINDRSTIDEIYDQQEKHLDGFYRRLKKWKAGFGKKRAKVDDYRDRYRQRVSRHTFFREDSNKVMVVENRVNNEVIQKIWYQIDGSVGFIDIYHNGTIIGTVDYSHQEGNKALELCKKLLKMGR